MNILNEHLLDPIYLNIEISEDEAMEDIDLITEVLSELKLKGIGISVDDFGTGYSSFNWVIKLPISTIKIDRSLIIDLETEAEFATLKELGCNFIQGYLIGKPMPSSDFQHIFIVN